MRRVIKLAKSQNITSIADFIAARYGKSQAVAATVALIAIIGSVPYIALQLKAVASSLETILIDEQAISSIPLIGDIALIATLAMAAFAVLFGTRQTDATEHQHGLMLAIATESIVKLVAFLAAGAFVTFWMFSPHELIERAMKTPEAVRAIEYAPSVGNFLTMMLLSFCAIMLLPRQFHVSVVENSTPAEVGRARWLFPLYLVAINLFVIPIALAGLITFPFGAVDSDMYVLALPVEGDAPLLSVAVFVGGLSAATAMVIVECVALSVMVSNDIIMPLVLQRAARDRQRPDRISAGSSWGRAALRSSRSWRWRISIIARWARPNWSRSGCCPSRRSRSSRRPFSADCSGNARPRGAPWEACWSALPMWAYTLFLPSFLDGTTGRAAFPAKRSARDRGAAAAGAARLRPAASSSMACSGRSRSTS